MSMSDDEDGIFHDRDLLEWAREAPEHLDRWDEHPITEDERAFRDAEVKEWLERKPLLRQYENKPMRRL